MMMAIPLFIGVLQRLVVLRCYEFLVNERLNIKYESKGLLLKNVAGSETREMQAVCMNVVKRQK